MKNYGFGIIGCGMISEFHAASIADIPNARIVAAADFVAEKVKTFAEKHNCESHSDYNEMLPRGDIDIVCVCTPSGAHLEPAVAAANAGKHIICEKPIEVTLERADAIINACDQNKVKLCPIFPIRFTEIFRAAKRAVDEGRFGRITLGDSYGKWWRSQDYYDSSGWRGTWKLDGGGACMNQGIHGIDMIQCLMGPVDTIVAYTDCLAHERVEVEDTAVAIVRYKSGAMGVIECATSVNPALPRKIEIHGDKGTIILTDDTVVKWEFAEEKPEDAELRDKFSPDKVSDSNASSDPGAFDYASHREQIADFIHALETGAPPTVDGREGRKAIEIIIAIYQSAKTGKPVTLPLGKSE